jgi:hypothetical protein
MDVTKKSIGIMIDDLITTSMKMWHLQDDVEFNNPTDAEVAAAFKKIQGLNVRRNKLINAIDEIINPDVATTTDKNYK